jgi:hypothetical protein
MLTRFATAIHFPSGDQVGQTSSSFSSDGRTPESWIGFPPSTDTLNTRNDEKMALRVDCIPDPRSTTFVVSTSFETNEIHLPSGDQVGCPGLPFILVSWRAGWSPDSPSGPIK